MPTWAARRSKWCSSSYGRTERSSHPSRFDCGCRRAICGSSAATRPRHGVPMGLDQLPLRPFRSRHRNLWWPGNNTPFGGVRAAPPRSSRQEPKMDTPRHDHPDLRRDSLSALTSIRKWKSFFLLLAVLCLATHAVAWAAVRFKWVPAAPRSAAVDAESAATQPDEGDRRQAEKAWNAMRVALPTTEFVGRLSALLLCLSLLMAVQIALVGRLPVAGIVQAF